MTATITTRTTAPPTGEGTAAGVPLTNLQMDSNLNSLISRSYASDTAGTAAFTVADTYYQLVSNGIKFIRIAGAPSSAGTAVSFNINSKGVKNLKFMTGEQVYDFHLRQFDILEIMYDGTNYVWLNPINRVLDFSSYLGANYEIKPEEVVRVDIGAVASQPLKVAFAQESSYLLTGYLSGSSKIYGFAIDGSVSASSALYSELNGVAAASSTLITAGVISSEVQFNILLSNGNGSTKSTIYTGNHAITTSGAFRNYDIGGKVNSISYISTLTLGVLDTVNSAAFSATPFSIGEVTIKRLS